MPMNFPDMASLIRHAQVRKYRAPNPGETEEAYREFVAASVETDPKYPDLVEAQEIRNKVGWDKWDKAQKLGMLLRGISR